MSVYKLQAAGSGGTENSLASLDVQFDGDIVGMFGTMMADLDADAELIQAELSFMSSNTVGSNDARGSLLLLQGRMSLTTSGVALLAVNDGISGLAIPVAAGERLHLHVVSTAGVSSAVTFYVYVADGAPSDLRRRR